jgi:hypothetical protein
MRQMIAEHSAEHAEQFSTWADSVGYEGGRTGWYASDGSWYDLGGPSTVYRSYENDVTV